MRSPKNQAFRALAFAVTTFVSLALSAQAASVSLSEAEFRALAEELAPKVNLFRDAWADDPSVEFFGGTTRDYLYWLKHEFADLGSPAEVERVRVELRARPVIDVRDFVIGDSDVDLVTRERSRLSPSKYGVLKIDAISPDRLDPSTSRGQDEVRQGYIPIEKIRLKRTGFVKDGVFGDGVSEIYRGQVTFHPSPAEDFAQTGFAQKSLNHPVLLALRYLRLAAMNYYQLHGARVPGPELLSELDPESAAKAREAIRAASEPGALAAFITQTKFVEWMSNVIDRSFRSYTNPTAADALLREFGVYDLLKQYPGLHPTDQYLFAKARDTAAIDRELRKLGFDPGTLFDKVEERFPDRQIYHGARHESGFRAILLQGVRPSEGGTAGKGLYGVANTNKQFAITWAGAEDRVVKFPVKREARILDITREPGLTLREKFASLNDETFCERFGIDILGYPYGSEAFVVKNAAVLGRAEGETRSVPTFARMLQDAAQVRDREGLMRFLTSMDLGQFTLEEQEFLLTRIASPEVQRLLQAAEKLKEPYPTLEKGGLAVLAILPEDDTYRAALERFTATAASRFSLHDQTRVVRQIVTQFGSRFLDIPGVLDHARPWLKGGRNLESLLLQLGPAEAFFRIHPNLFDDYLHTVNPGGGNFRSVSEANREGLLARLRAHPEELPWFLATVKAKGSQMGALLSSVDTFQAKVAAVASYREASDLAGSDEVKKSVEFPDFISAVRKRIADPRFRAFFDGQVEMRRRLEAAGMERKYDVVLPTLVGHVLKVYEAGEGAKTSEDSLESVISERIAAEASLESNTALEKLDSEQREGLRQALADWIDPGIRRQLEESEGRWKLILKAKSNLLRREDGLPWRLGRALRDHRWTVHEFYRKDLKYGALALIPPVLYGAWFVSGVPAGAEPFVWASRLFHDWRSLGGALGASLSGVMGFAYLAVDGRDAAEDQIHDFRKAWTLAAPSDWREHEIRGERRGIEKIRCIAESLRKLP